MIKVRYFVVYNVAIDMSTVADLRDVISTLHLTMKYPVRDGMLEFSRQTWIWPKSVTICSHGFLI